MVKRDQQKSTNNYIRDRGNMLFDTVGMNREIRWWYTSCCRILIILLLSSKKKSYSAAPIGTSEETEWEKGFWFLYNICPQRGSHHQTEKEPGHDPTEWILLPVIAQTTRKKKGNQAKFFLTRNDLLCTDGMVETTRVVPTSSQSPLFRILSTKNLCFFFDKYY